jgi:hypothetical protein
LLRPQRFNGYEAVTPNVHEQLEAATVDDFERGEIDDVGAVLPSPVGTSITIERHVVPLVRVSGKSGEASTPQARRHWYEYGVRAGEPNACWKTARYVMPLITRLGGHVFLSGMMRATSPNAAIMLAPLFAYGLPGN